MTILDAETDKWLLLITFFLAGFARSARRRHRSSNGEPRRLLADFNIGTQALTQTDRLMTLDRKRYERDFTKRVLALRCSGISNVDFDDLLPQGGVLCG